ncbi:MAG: toll/interleukin-1 receptor domain-containing protein [Armatimonadetes bacterium]|nr:toll/interleukin-1 receptor domain-containing protein [Armatimonadota bacterium]
MKDFFISYNRADRPWAEWIAWQLEAAGYTTVLQAWDFRPGSNFALEMQQAAVAAARTLAVLSPDYLAALYTQPEWAAAVTQDPTGERGTLLPVRVRACDLQGLLRPIVYIDLMELDEAGAQATLLAGVRRARAKPQSPPAFPGAALCAGRERPRFPASAPVGDADAAASRAAAPWRLGSEPAAGGGPVGAAPAGRGATIGIEITINRDFDEYTEADQERLLRAMREFLQMEDELRITKKRRSSVKLTLELLPAQAESYCGRSRQASLQNLVSSMRNCKSPRNLRKPCRLRMLERACPSVLCNREIPRHGVPCMTLWASGFTG